MMKRFIFSLALAAVSLLQIQADSPFRNHRYDSFKAAQVNDRSIVFVGNSITNMHEWREAFGDDPRIINRGNSGAVSQETLDNIETVIAGKPAKMFLLIGTNDLGSTEPDVPVKVAANIRKIIDRVQQGSPATEIFIQSILPSTTGARTPERIAATNCLIRKECDETGVTYIDLSDLLADLPTDHSLSYDHLHLTAKAYTLWCNAIAPYVGVECTYPDTATTKYSDDGFNNSFGMRITQWSANEVKPSDILIIGDEMIHGGEWHELLGNPDVKNRGINWGYGGISLEKWKEAVPALLLDNPDRKAAPKQIFVYAGVQPAYNGTEIPVLAGQYADFISALQAAAPSTEINILSLIPRQEAELNETRTIPVNEALRALADSTEGVNFVDIYTPLTAEGNNLEADPTCITDNYLYARGYNRIAQILAPLTGGHALSTAQFEENYNMIQSRQDAARKAAE